MILRQRIPGLFALLLFLSLPAQAGVLYFCQMMGESSRTCCCPAPEPGDPAVLKEPGGACCCNQYRWDDPAPSLSKRMQALVTMPVLAVVAVLDLDETVLSCEWIEATTILPDPNLPPLYLTSRSFLS